MTDRGRNPKSETRNPKEGRNPKSERTCQAGDPRRSATFGFRDSDFLRVSGFGFRISRQGMAKCYKEPIS